MTSEISPVPFAVLKGKQNVFGSTLISLTSCSAPVDFIYAQHRERALLNKLRLDFDWPCLSLLLLGMFSQRIQFIFGKGCFAVSARIEQPQGIEQLAEKEVKPSPCVEGHRRARVASVFSSGWLQAPSLHLPVGSTFYPRSLSCMAKDWYSLRISRHLCPRKHNSQTKLGLYAVCGDKEILLLFPGLLGAWFAVNKLKVLSLPERTA